MDKTIIHKYLTGTATEEEKQKLLEWLRASAENEAEFFELRAIWHIKDRPIDAEEQLLTSLKNLNSRIDKQAEQQMKTQPRIFWYRYAAAVAVLLMIISFATWEYNKKNKAEIPMIVCSNMTDDNSIQKIYLPDSTAVWLSSHTTLTYPVEFVGKEREVSIEGKAFFEVKRDTLHPFLIETGIHKIKVLGTSFSVNTRIGNEVCETILANGSVSLEHSDGSQIAVLSPGQQAFYSHLTHSIKINEVDANALTSWRFGIISLTQVTISDIIKQIENTYKIKIKMDTTSICNHRYNYSFKAADNAAKVLEQLTFVTGIEAKIVQ